MYKHLNIVWLTQLCAEREIQHEQCRYKHDYIDVLETYDMYHDKVIDDNDMHGSAPVHRHLSNFLEVVAAAVSAEKRSRERRAKSLIVSGMVPSVNSTDNIIFTRLCMIELGIEPTVVFTRRHGNDTGRVRPLLVCLPCE